MAVVTALRAAPAARAPCGVAGDHVEVELDGLPWRSLPLEAVLAAGIDVGIELDRPRARRLARELRRLDARRAALSALRSRDHTADTLRRRLVARGVPPRAREEAVSALARTGVVDDRRFAERRAAALAARGAGDLRIRFDLASRGVAQDTIAEALAALEPERERVRRILGEEPPTIRTLRRLAANGFAEDSLAGLVADHEDPELRYEGFV